MTGSLLVLLAALLVDRFWRDQHKIWRRIPHPVVLFGKLIDQAEAFLRAPRGTPQRNRINGTIALILLLLVTLVAGWLMMLILDAIPVAGPVMEIAIVAVLLSQRSLADHVGAVAVALRHEGLSGGRREVAKIVGRDPQQLDGSGVARGALESLAENTSDGVVAPAFWYVLLGLPGLLAYKMLNTADSMIGHLNKRYADFGRATARTDDLANLIPARLTGLAVVAAAWSLMGARQAKRAAKIMMRDSRMHRSPNAGWPEAAFAGALRVSLSGPRSYGGFVANEPVVNAAGTNVAGAPDIERGLALFWRTCTVLTATVALLLLVG